jgi:hypothetical protein
MTRVVGLICLSVLLVSIAVHMASYALIVPLPLEKGAGFMQLVVLLACLLAVLAGLVVAWRVSRARRCSLEQAWEALRARMPEAALWTFAVVFLYVWCLQAWLFLAVEQGCPRRSDDGGFVLSSHGRLIRPLTEQEYWRLQAHNLRAISGLWISFSLGAVLFLRSLPRGRGMIVAGPPPNQSLQLPGVARSGSWSSQVAGGAPGR